MRLKIVILAIILLILASIGVLAFNYLRPKTTAKQTVAVATFDFDASKAPGWFAGANIDGNAANSTSSTGAKLGTTTRIVAQGSAEQPTGNCFVQFSYYANNSKDPVTALSEVKTLNESSGGLQLKFTNLLEQNMLTSTGGAPYQLYQYEVVGSDAQKISRGEQFGFFKTGTGYVDIRGYCATVDELSVTLPVLSAVSFK